MSQVNMQLPLLTVAKDFLNNTFQNKEPWQIVTITTTTVLTSMWMWTFICQDESIVSRVKKQACRLARRIPGVQKKIDTELASIEAIFMAEASRRIKDVPCITELPKEGFGHDEILQKVKQCVHLGDYDWKGGKVSGAVYRHESKLVKLMADVYGMASYTNPLHPDIFPGICKMEAEVVRIACNLFHGDKETCGSMTIGGTESIFLACKTYRDYAREVKGITKPEMVIPVTAHPAFHKAAQYLNIRVRLVPINTDSYTVCVNDMKRAISRNTIMLVGSAPNFPYGTIDNIEAIATLGEKYDIPVHVDACLGGFLICFMEDAGFKLPLLDFRLKGVISISADTHKYGYAPKGSSIVLYRHKKYKRFQYTCSTDWPGGIYGSPTISGSRAGGIIAACWSTLMYFGHEGYLQSTKKIIETTNYIDQELRKVDGIFIFGTPGTSVIAVGSKQFDVYKLSNALNKRGWNLNNLQFPNGFHLCVTYIHTEPGVADQFLDDVRNEVSVIMESPDLPVEGKLALYGMCQTIVDRRIVGECVQSFLDSTYYLTDESKTRNGPHKS